MTYALKQVQPLLTASELALFKASRRNAVTHMTEEQLRNAIQRSRALRDKYRDLYRRQSVATETGRDAQGKTTRAHHGGENARTLKKSEILADILTRFEERLAKLRAGKARTVQPVLDMVSLQQDVRDALDSGKPDKDQPAHEAAAGQPTHVGTSAKDVARGAVPTGITPAAMRQNMLKEAPVNKKIHASARGRNKAFQSARDAR